MTCTWRNRESGCGERRGCVFRKVRYSRLCAHSVRALELVELTLRAVHLY